MLGQFDPEADKERKQRYNNSVIANLFNQKYGNKNNSEDINIINAKATSIEELKLSEGIKATLQQIRSQDSDFDFDKFISGVRKAYIMTIKAINESDFKTLEFLIESELYTKIKQEIESSKLSGLIKRDSVANIETITLVDAMLYGDRAVLTVEIKSQQTSFTEDTNGNLISGSVEKTFEKIQKFTFCRYLTQSTVWKISKMS
jgi:predicted lipid-binding transport protein (Tim44 family)